MSDDPERPIIIKKKKVVGGGGHHGGAWKVAYADFVTAMMAFFMMMWLLNATTEQQRMGLADYFSPSIPITRVSGGGDGAFGGDDVFSEQTIAQEGTGATNARPTEGRQNLGTVGAEYNDDEQVMEALGDALAEAGGDAAVIETILEHIQTRLTDEGLVIEVFSRPEAPLFDASGEPIYWLPLLAEVLASLFETVTNQVAVEAHVPTAPLVRQSTDRFILAAQHAMQMRGLLEDGGLRANRLDRITGHGDSDPVMDDPLSIRNDRLEIILLRGIY
ncbi:MAG: flagellar motor protein MotB [Pseudomonadota bacterium]